MRETIGERWCQAGTSIYLILLFLALITSCKGQDKTNGQDSIVDWIRFGFAPASKPESLRI